MNHIIVLVNNMHYTSSSGIFEAKFSIRKMNEYELNANSRFNPTINWELNCHTHKNFAFNSAPSCMPHAISIYPFAN